MTIKNFIFLFLITLSSTSIASSYEGYFVDKELDYPAFLGECSALLTIYMQGGEKQETYERNYQKYMLLIDELNNEEKERSFSFQEFFIDRISEIKTPSEEEYWGLRNDMSVCAYWTGFKKHQYLNFSSARP